MTYIHVTGYSGMNVSDFWAKNSDLSMLLTTLGDCRYKISLIL